MKVQQPEPKNGPPRGPPPRKVAGSEDVIPAEQTENVKREAMKHLARQAGRDTASRPKEDGGDNSKETQKELQTQMDSQKKPAEHGEEKVAEDKGKKEEMEKKEEGKKEKEGKREEEGKKEKEGKREEGKKDEKGKKEGIEQELKTKTKTPTEDSKPKAAPEKGPGW